MDKNSLLIQLSESGRFWSIDFENLSPPERVFRAIWELEADVNNGGFEQYYTNSAGDTAFAVIDALKQVGANQAARIVAEANGVFPDSAPPQDRDEREEAVESLGEEQMARWSTLDDEFITYPDDLTELLFEYVKKHSKEIEGATKLIH